MLSTARSAGFGGRLLPLAVLTGLFLLELGVLLVFDGGRLVFTLDDPYIHMAFAENLRLGHFGLNAGEFSSPSSSILWSVLMVPLTVFPGTEWAVLFLNFAFAAGTLWVIQRFLELTLEPGTTRRVQLAVVVLAVLAIPAANLLGLVLTGMEHSLQVLLTALLVLGVVVAEREGSSPSWLVPVLVVGPLVRYENMALSLAVMLWMWWSGGRRKAIIAALLLLFLVGGYSVFLYSLELPLLPTSVIAKTVERGQASLPESLIMILGHNLTFPKGIFMTLGVVLLARMGTGGRLPPVDRRVALCFALGLSLHMVLGRFGANHRYGIYAWTAALLVFVRLVSIPLRRWIAGHSIGTTTLAASCVLGIGSMAHVTVLLTAPLASQNIYRQQFQMHRFVADYWDRPLAANDIGWVAYRNDNYILDLVGLASADVIRIRRESGRDLAALAPLVSARGIRLALIYEGWFDGERPENWSKLGELRLSGRLITPAYNRVAFYAVDGVTPGLVEMLRTFDATLPTGADFVFEGRDLQ